MSYAGDLPSRRAYEVLATEPDAVLIDVRTRAEWQYVGVPDLEPLGRHPVLIEWQRFPGGDINGAFLDELADAGVTRERTLLFLCRSGARSRSAAIAATSAGYERSFNVSDGFEGPPDHQERRGTISGWKHAGLPWRQS